MSKRLTEGRLNRYNVLLMDDTRPAASALELLLGDFDREEFFSDYWEKRSFFMHHNDPGRFSHLLSRERFMEHTVHHCGHLRANFFDSRNWSAEVELEPSQAEKVYESGMTVGASVLDAEGELKAFLDSFRAGVYSAATPHFNAYYSPDGKGYIAHFDTHPVWLMQVDGRKHWRIGREPVIRNPQFNIVFPPDREVLRLPWITIEKPALENDEKFVSVTLNPGDVIYMPPGTWHQARAEGFSLALTLAQSRITALDLLLTVLQHSLPAPEFKALGERVGGQQAARRDGGHLDPDVEAVLAERLEMFKHLVSRIEMPNLRAAWGQVSRLSAKDMNFMGAKEVAAVLKNR